VLTNWLSVCLFPDLVTLISRFSQIFGSIWRLSCREQNNFCRIFYSVRSPMQMISSNKRFTLPEHCIRRTPISSNTRNGLKLPANRRHTAGGGGGGVKCVHAPHEFHQMAYMIYGRHLTDGKTWSYEQTWKENLIAQHFP